MDLIVSLLSNFSIFQSIDEFNLRDIVSLLNLKKYPKGSIVLTKGTPAQKFYILLSGTAEIASGMTGQLSQMSSIELLQALNISQKTGMVILNLPRGNARLYLRCGDLIEADYCNKVGREAVYEILKEKEGQFNFSPNLPQEQLIGPEIGSLMEIILDTTRMMDEEAHTCEKLS